MQLVVNLIFTLMQSSSGFNLFDKILVKSMVKELKKLDKGAMLLKKVIA